MADYGDFSVEKLNELAYQNDPEAQRTLIIKALCGEPGVSNSQCEYWLKQLEENENVLCKGIGHFLHGHYLLKKDFSKAVMEFASGATSNYYPAALMYVYYAPFRYYENLYVRKPGDEEIYRSICEYFNYDSEYEARRHCADNFLTEILQKSLQIAESKEDEVYSGKYTEELRYLFTFLGCYYYDSKILLHNGHLDESHSLRNENFEIIFKNDIIKAEKYLLKAISYGEAYEAYSILGAIYTKIYEYEVKYIDDVSLRNFTDYKQKGFEYFVKAIDGSPEKIVNACAYARVIKSYLDGEYSNDNITEIIRKYFQRKEYTELTDAHNNALSHWDLYFELSFEDLRRLKSRVPDDIRSMIDSYIHRSEVWICWNCGTENKARAADCTKCNSRLSGRFAPLKSLPHTPPTKISDGPVKPNIEENEDVVRPNGNTSKSSSGGCYIATCVYGSYDCPEVWVLRRYRDYHMKKTFWGRWFINVYYKYSPKIVEKYGNYHWFHGCIRPVLNRIVDKLSSLGIKDTPYTDQ